ncbi:MAG: AMP-binding protein, partial [Oscillospiraceae bacterium]
MPITAFLEKNAMLYGDETALVEINPDSDKKRSDDWREFALVEVDADGAYRREFSWADFDRRANQFANLLLANGIGRGDKVAILLMNCLEWLPIYFGALKAGALAVPLNYRYTAEEIKYCLDLSDTSILMFGREFVGRIDAIRHDIPKVKKLFYVGGHCPEWAQSY